MFFVCVLAYPNRTLKGRQRPRAKDEQTSFTTHVQDENTACTTGTMVRKKIRLFEIKISQHIQRENNSQSIVDSFAHTHTTQPIYFCFSSHSKLSFVKFLIPVLLLSPYYSNIFVYLNLFVGRRVSSLICLHLCVLHLFIAIFVSPLSAECFTDKNTVYVVWYTWVVLTFNCF